MLERHPDHLFQASWLRFSSYAPQRQTSSHRREARISTSFDPRQPLSLMLLEPSGAGSCSWRWGTRVQLNKPTEAHIITYLRRLAGSEAASLLIWWTPRANVTVSHRRTAWLDKSGTRVSGATLDAPHSRLCGASCGGLFGVSPCAIWPLSVAGTGAEGTWECADGPPRVYVRRTGSLK